MFLVRSNGFNPLGVIDIKIVLIDYQINYSIYN